MEQLQTDICTYLQSHGVPVKNCIISDTEIVINMRGTFYTFDPAAYDIYFAFLNKCRAVLGFAYRDFYAINPNTKAMNPCASITIHNDYVVNMEKEDLISYLSANFKRFILI